MKNPKLYLTLWIFLFAMQAVVAVTLLSASSKPAPSPSAASLRPCSAAQKGDAQKELLAACLDLEKILQAHREFEGGLVRDTEASYRALLYFILATAVIQGLLLWLSRRPAS